MANAILHDLRLHGRIPRDRTDILVLTQEGRLPSVSIRAIKAQMEREHIAQLSRLTLICHGIVSLTEHTFALQIGDYITEYNAYNVGRCLVGMTAKIKVKTCGTVGGEDSNPAVYASMLRVYRQLARGAETQVIAADETQYYTGANSGEISFGGWEGPLWRYAPDGTRSRVPVEAAAGQ
jgi:hypothetical protein